MATMKALYLTKLAPDSFPALTLLSRPKPSLTPGHILVKVQASSIQPSDIINSKGVFPYTTFPRIPGRDFSGTIIEGPPSRIGQEVYGTSGNSQAFTVDGAQAEFILVKEDAVAEKPKNLSWVQAATVGVPFTTASLVLKRAGVKQGETVLVLGANGAVGNATVQLAKAKGARVLRATRNDSSDVNTASDPTLSAVDALTSKKGVDVVIDTVGSPSLTSAAVSKLGRNGRLVFIAAPKSGSTELGIDMLDFYRQQKVLLGVNSLLSSVEEMAKELEALRELFEKGEIEALKEGEWNEVPLENGVEAYRKAGERGAGKFVLVMD